MLQRQAGQTTLADVIDNTNDAELAIEILLNAVALIRERGWQKGTCIREFDCETCMVPLFEFRPQPEMRIHVDAACEPAGPLSLWEAVCVSARRVAAQQQVTYGIMSRVTNMMRGQIGGEYSLVEWVNRLDDSAFPAMALALLQEAADELAGGYE